MAVDDSTALSKQYIHCVVGNDLAKAIELAKAYQLLLRISKTEKTIVLFDL